jgi:hypothetical protein
LIEGQEAFSIQLDDTHEAGCTSVFRPATDLLWLYGSAEPLPRGAIRGNALYFPPMIRTLVERYNGRPPIS